MSEKYSSFIELTPGYESVVNLNSDSDAQFWSRYIVNDDMVVAVDLLAQSLRPEDPVEDVWHYWLKGAYGTGKTYSAIVIKHLLMDDYPVVEDFLSKNPLFRDVKDKFLASRKRSQHLVAFRSGECKQLNTSNKFLFEIEKSVRELLQENNLSYTGKNSLLESVCASVTTFKSTLADSFEDGNFPEYWSTYDSFDDFYQEVLNHQSKACLAAQEILQALNIGLATNLETLTKWLKDIFNGNQQLKETGAGIFIIWDEFTEYIRENDLDIIQHLSMLSKEIPFFMIYVMHEYPGIFDQNVTAGMGKADARFHKIDIKISEKTTLKLIGESIIPVDGKKNEWMGICDQLHQSLLGHMSVFTGDPDSEVDANLLKNIFPMHPMTVNLVSKVAGLAASNRSIFEFLKSNGEDGFRSFIQENGAEDWKWVTVDYLWDYYFVNNQGGKKHFPQMTEDALKHYVKSESLISDGEILRVYKGALLLLATIGSGNRLRGRMRRGTIQATEKTLCHCFAGSLDGETVKSHLRILGPAQLKLLVLADDSEEGCRIELPYAGSGDEQGEEIEKLEKSLSPSTLFQNDNLFGSALIRQFIPDDKAAVKRLVALSCWGNTQQINSKFSELQKTVEKTHHKFGLLIIAPPSVDKINGIMDQVSSLYDKSTTSRLLVAVLRYPLEEAERKTWYSHLANGNLAQKNGNAVNASSYKTQAEELIEIWVSTALGKEIMLYCNGAFQQAFTNRSVIKIYENHLATIFPASPEQILRTNTLYKTPSVNAAYFAVARVSEKTKMAGNERHKNFNNQWQGCVNALSGEEENLFDSNDIQKIIAMKSTKAGVGVGALCQLLENQFASGTVMLSDLWEKMQKELGYYDTMACSYLVGFAFKFYLGKFTWYDGTNGNKLAEESVPNMVQAMLTRKSAGMKLSSESDIEKHMKRVTGEIFDISKEHLGDIFDCQKYLKVSITDMVH